MEIYVGIVISVSIVIMTILYYYFIRSTSNTIKTHIPTNLKPTTTTTTTTNNNNNSSNSSNVGINKVRAKKGRSIGEEVELRVLWGSQTGTAEAFANKLVEEAKARTINAISMDMDLYDINLMYTDTAVLLFVTATYGEGEPTDNAKYFTDIIKSNDIIACPSVRYIVFGLGNKTYEHYNAMGRLIDRRMEELGAKRLYERGEGDDDANLEEDFQIWRKKMWPAVVKILKGIDEVSSTADDEEIKWEPRYKLQTGVHIEATTPLTGRFLKLNNAPFDIKNPYLAKILMNVSCIMVVIVVVDI